MSLLSLPPELLSYVLRSLDSPQDLLSTITASRDCYVIFQRAPQLFLASVLHNAIEPEAMHHALAALATRTPQAAHHSPSALDRFLNDYFAADPSASPFRFPSTMPMLISLCHLYNTISLFIYDYVFHASQTLGSPGDLDRDPDGMRYLWPLSPTERARFQRAFLRYEVYCKVFPTADPPADHPGHEFKAGEQYRRFLRHLNVVEVEEMSCVHSYLMWLTAGFMDCIEDELMEEVCLAAEEALQVDDDAFRNLVGFRDLDLRELSNYSRDAGYRANETLSFYASFGSVSMRHLVRADQDGRRNKFRMYDWTTRDFLPEAIEAAPSGTAHAGTMSTMDGDGTHRTPTDRSSCVHSSLRVFKWLRRGHYLSINLRNAFTASRSRAYVFWDVERLTHDHIARSLHEAAILDSAPTTPQYDRTCRKTVEERLDGIRVTPANKQRIFDRYGMPKELYSIEQRVTSFMDLINDD